MREPVRTTRTGRDAARPQQPQPRRRLRNRLLAAVVVTVVAVLAAGAPSVALAVRDLSESQRLLRLTQLNTSAIALSHALADERDDMTGYVASGRSSGAAHQVGQDERDRVDRQATDLGRAAAELDTAGSSDLVRVTGDLRTSLAGITGIRETALTGHGSARAVFDSYTPVIDTLDSVSGALARALPARAADPDTSAGPALAEAVSQASAEHGLLVAALTRGRLLRLADRPGPARPAARGGAYDDFAATASTTARTQYAQTVTGTDVTDAETYLRQLTDQPYLTSDDNALSTADVDTALSARVDRMRAVQSSLAAADSIRLTALRDDDVTALEVRAALVGLCALLALAIGVQTARSVTRPLARLRGYAAEPAGEPPTASGDEFAALALAVQRLAQDLTRLGEAAGGQDQERARLAGVQRTTAAELDELRRVRAELLGERAVLIREKDALTARIGSLQGTVHSTFVNLALRTLGLVERQLALIESLENREQDPDELETLFKLDHLATRMRRNSESLLVLAGAEHRRRHDRPNRSRWSTSYGLASRRSSGTSGSHRRSCRAPSSPGSPPTTSATWSPNSWRTPPRSRRRDGRRPGLRLAAGERRGDALGRGRGHRRYRRRGSPSSTGCWRTRVRTSPPSAGLGLFVVGPPRRAARRPGPAARAEAGRGGRRGRGAPRPGRRPAGDRLDPCGDRHGEPGARRRARPGRSPAVRRPGRARRLAGRPGLRARPPAPRGHRRPSDPSTARRRRPGTCHGTGSGPRTAQAGATGQRAHR